MKQEKLPNMLDLLIFIIYIRLFIYNIHYSETNF